MKITPFIRYPKHGMNILATDQTSVKQCIYDFNQAMLSAGLIRTNDTNQLDASDINNIPEIFGLLYTKEAEYQMEIIKQYDDLRYSHLSTKPVHIPLQKQPLYPQNPYLHNV